MLPSPIALIFQYFIYKFIANSLPSKYAVKYTLSLISYHNRNFVWSSFCLEAPKAKWLNKAINDIKSPLHCHYNFSIDQVGNIKVSKHLHCSLAQTPTMKKIGCS